MVVVIPLKDVPFLQARGRLGISNGLGFHILGWTRLGEVFHEAGTYAKNGRWKNQKLVKRRHSYCGNPRTTIQQARRLLFADGVGAWRSLDPTQQGTYRRQAAKINMSGFNLFMREYLNSH